MSVLCVRWASSTKLLDLIANGWLLCVVFASSGEEWCRESCGVGNSSAEVQQLFNIDRVLSQGRWSSSALHVSMYSFQVGQCVSEILSSSIVPLQERKRLHHHGLLLCLRRRRSVFIAEHPPVCRRRAEVPLAFL